MDRWIDPYFQAEAEFQPRPRVCGRADRADQRRSKKYLKNIVMWKGKLEVAAYNKVDVEVEGYS